MNNDKCYMSIDPGARGVIVTQYKGKFRHYSIADNDLYQLADIMAEIRQKYPNIVCVMESVHALFGSSAKATFSFGEIFGELQALLAANKIPFVLVQPKEWQKEMWINSDLVVTYESVTIRGKATTKKEVNTKATSINAAKRLFPTMDFRRTDRCKNIDDNLVDAVLMSEYARRKNL